MRGDTGQHLPRLGVRPVQVVEQDGHGSFVRHGGEQLHQCRGAVQQLLAASALGRDRGVPRRERGIERDERGGGAGRDSRGAGKCRKLGGDLGGGGERDAALSRVGARVERAGAGGAQARERVLEQARLAEPGGGGDVHVARGAAFGVVPRREDGRELLLATHQLGHEGRPGTGCVIGGRLAGPADGGARRRLRLAFLGLEQPLERVGLHRTLRPVVPRDQGLEQQAPAILVQAVGIACPPRHTLGLAHVTLSQVPAGQRLGAPQEGGAQADTLQVRPLLELGAAWRREVGQEFPGVPLRGGGDVPVLDRGEERVAVRDDARVEYQVAVTRHQYPFAYGVPDLPDGLAQGVEGALGLRVRPQHAHQVLAAGAAARGEREVRDQREGLARAEQRDGRGAVEGERQPRAAEGGERQAGVRSAGTRSFVRHLTEF
jgi:hypothetical protein